MKKMLKAMLMVILIIILVLAVYLLYLFMTYDRIEDGQNLAIESDVELDQAFIGEEYTIVTQNIGFGAYSDDFTFFMDGGKESRARSEKAVYDNTEGVLREVKDLAPDIILFQEVDLDSTRSFHVDQYELLRNEFGEYDSTKGINYDSAYLFYPLLEPHGKSLSSIATFSRFQMDKATRRSLPVSTGYAKFFDLDRCYTITEIPVEQGKTLFVYNVHLSAYGGSPEIRDGQMDMLIEDMKEKISQGDYVICGGDFNHDFTGDSVQKLNKEVNDFGWAQPFPAEKLPADLKRCVDYQGNQLVPTTRNTDIPYEKGVSFVVILDGFILSSNVTCTEVENIDNGFRFTDHNPVRLKFILN